MADSAVGAIRPTQSSSLRHAVRSAPRLALTPATPAAPGATPRESYTVPGAAFARFEASLRGQARALFDDAFEQRLGARQVLLRRGAEHAPRIDGDQQFATVGRRTAALVVGQRLGTGQVADQRTGEQFDHRRQGRALVPAESEHGASQRGAGIGGRLALLVHPPAQRDRLAGAFVQLDLATRHGAGGEVEDERRAVRTRPAKGDRVGAEDRLASARRRHPGMTRRGRQGHQARLGECLDLNP